MMRLLIIIFLISWCWQPVAAQGALWQTKDGSVQFVSDAPLEMITASSDEMRGLIKPEGNVFAFAVNINSFEGFNSPLQKQHFNENYMESSRFPQTTFKGRIIEDVQFEQEGRYTVRAKGILNVHGVEQERIIKSEMIIRGGEIQIHSLFTLRLDDHNITVPRIVNQKIAQVIQLEVSARLIKINNP